MPAHFSFLTRACRFLGLQNKDLCFPLQRLRQFFCVLIGTDDGAVMHRYDPLRLQPLHSFHRFFGRHDIRSRDWKKSNIDDEVPHFVNQVRITDVINARSVDLHNKTKPIVLLGMKIFVRIVTGVGKSFLACALGDQACRTGYSVRYCKMPELLSDLLQARADGSFRSFSAKLRKVSLLIIDEWLRDPLSQADAREEELSFLRAHAILSDTAFANGGQLFVYHTGLEPMVVGFYRAVVSVLAERRAAKTRKPLIVRPRFFRPVWTAFPC